MSEKAPLDFTSGNLTPELDAQIALSESILQQAETKEELEAVQELNKYLVGALQTEQDCSDLSPHDFSSNLSSVVGGAETPHQIYHYPNKSLCHLRRPPVSGYPKYPYPPKPELVIRTLYNSHYGLAVSLQNSAEEKARAEDEFRSSGGPEEIVGADAAMAQADMDRAARVQSFAKWHPNWMFWGGLALAGWGAYGKYGRKG